ncbi:hypothetical protein TPHA_0B03850 [Tetrapisispora phaffii CBS 4417]|uniref:non-specific serine/threonine protein kinase n=1 Tax=Tetrapisispora phaffii (strain ATCC 24235 / CBS 4417 / NBRC 1672 / NRRL Y-8282 / UCD 70-5) TaxID=1071381 RepID=G8BPX6_TETPH|nr:hypothetical protein TPHA_0B03850 [Tetrapisispora phaffii CBS 4417]CCE62057.1 hypothetical protein TPHA_0B03850 [Tetrapisispora phaffii CBS 4417]
MAAVVHQNTSLTKKNSFLKRNITKYFGSNQVQANDSITKTNDLTIETKNLQPSSSPPSTVSSNSSSINSTPKVQNNPSCNDSTPTLTSVTNPNNNVFEVNNKLSINEDATHIHNLQNLKRKDNISSFIKKISISKNKNEGVKNIANAKWAVQDLFTDNNFTVEKSNNFNSNSNSDNNNNNGNNTKHNKSNLWNSNNNSSPLCTQNRISGFLKNINENVDVSSSKGPNDLPMPKSAPKPTLSTTVMETHAKMNFSDIYGCCKEIIGKGSYGTVRLCQKKSELKNSKPIFYAVKEIKRKENESCDIFLRRITSEFCISSSLKHPNIVQTLDLFADNEKNYFEVMEYCPGGDLFTLITSSENGKLTQIEADCFFKQILSGVNYMHDMGVAHRDLKPENILLTATGIVKIIDFGSSECFRMAWETNVHYTDYICGSTQYIAPEEYTKEKFDPRAVDVWACGMIYMAMVIGRHLWTTAQKSDEIYSTFLNDIKTEDGFEPIENFSDVNCKNVIYSILEPSPSRRLTTKQIMNCPWVKGIQCCGSK